MGWGGIIQMEVTETITTEETPRQGSASTLVIVIVVVVIAIGNLRQQSSHIRLLDMFAGKGILVR